MELDQLKEIPFEDKVTAVNLWVDGIARTGKVEEISQQLITSVLIDLGANLDIKELEKSSLSGYKNIEKRLGMNAVWGGEKYEAFKSWVETWANDYESQKGKPLPKLERSGSKISGMLQFFGELTAYGANAISFEDFKLYIEARALNGKLWQEGRLKERVRVKVPTKKQPILLSSFPPEFPRAAWEKIKSWRVLL